MDGLSSGRPLFVLTVFVQHSNTIDYEGVYERLDDSCLQPSTTNVDSKTLFVNDLEGPGLNFSVSKSGFGIGI